MLLHRFNIISTILLDRPNNIAVTCQDIVERDEENKIIHYRFDFLHLWG